MSQSGATLMVKCLEARGVEVIFGIPGAKIDALFNALIDSPIRIVHCRHEQNAAFMAAAYGRITGKPGVALVTSGPGISNLATGLLTATTEGDPVIAIGGNVPRSMKLKESHQSADNVGLLRAATKYHAEVTLTENIPEIVDNAFRAATAPRAGAAFISLPQDVLTETTTAQAHASIPSLHSGPASSTLINQAQQLIQQAKCPVLLLGQEASRPDCTEAIRDLLKHALLPVVSTYQGAGVVSRELLHTFFGRVGLFKNQPGDRLLEQADVVIAIGFNPAEYDPEIWHSKADKTLITIDYIRADIHTTYLPAVELIGDIAQSVALLQNGLAPSDILQSGPLQKLHTEWQSFAEPQSFTERPGKIHPLAFMNVLRAHIDDEVRVVSDIGSHYMWLSRHFLSYQPRRLLFSNGQQTLGVGLPWAMGSRFAEPDRMVISISGDGGFLFSAMALETAVRSKLDILHFVWDDCSYNMVEEQQMLKYQRETAVRFGSVDFAKLAESFGAHGVTMSCADELPAIIDRARQSGGVWVVHVPIDYQDNPAMFKVSLEQVGH